MNHSDSAAEGPQFADPKDTAMYLEQRGWEQVHDDPERWVGRYEANGRSMPGGIERTASGLRRFYVQDPPSQFVKQAEAGNCLFPRPELLENAYQVHFQQPPDSFGDGIDRIEELLGGDA